jgi:uncharacterized protein
LHNNFAILAKLTTHIFQIFIATSDRQVVEQGNSELQIRGKEYPEIKLRKFVRSNATPAERRWVRGDPFATAFFNALSVVFPEGETFMIRSVSTWRGTLPEPLNTSVNHFVYQEAAHCRQHNAENQAISASGYDIAPLENSIKNVVNRLQNMGPIGSLCGTMCIEHLTSIMSAEILAHDHLEGAHSDQRDFWEWHAIEEIEHKAVAFDLWHYVTRDWSATRRWAMRSSFMAIIVTSFLFNRTHGQLVLLRQDGFNTLPALRGIFTFGFGKGGIGRNIIGPLMQFFRPGFHPWQIDDRDLIVKGEALINAHRHAIADVVGTADSERRIKPRFAKAA